MNLHSFFFELRRRNVVRVGAFYAASAWLLVQVATQVFPFFHIAEWVVRWIVIAAAIGFPFAIVFAWFYEVTPEGLKRESEIDPAASITRQTGRRMDRWIIAIMAVAIVLLLANTFVLHEDAPGVAPASTADKSASEKSIAVLPLTNESGDAKDDYFSDGLSEDLITALSQFAGLKVISRNSSFQFRNSKDDSKAIGEKLGVAHLLEGSVRRAGDDVRISAALVKAADGSTAWSQHYDRPYKDLFKLQDDITGAVATSLKAKLLTEVGAAVQNERPTSGNLEAYNAFLKGKFYEVRQTDADIRKAIDFYNAAIKLDPDYAQAYASQSRAWSVLSGAFLSGAEAQQAFENARAAANSALRLAPDLAAAHLALGRLILWADFNWAGTEAEYRRALQLAPNDGSAKAALAEIQATLGHSEQAIELQQQALATDALNAQRYLWLTEYLMPTGRLDEAERAIRKAIQLQPTMAYAYPLLATIDVLRGNAAAALDSAVKTPPGMWQDIALAIARQVGSDRAAADAALQALIDKHADGSAFQVAETYAARKDPDRMFEWLDRAWANRDPGISSLLYDAFLRTYKDDPRFAAFCRKVGLPVPGTDLSAAR